MIHWKQTCIIGNHSFLHCDVLKDLESYSFPRVSLKSFSFVGNGMCPPSLWHINSASVYLDFVNRILSFSFLSSISDSWQIVVAFVSITFVLLPWLVKLADFHISVLLALDTLKKTCNHSHGCIRDSGKLNLIRWFWF